MQISTRRANLPADMKQALHRLRLAAALSLVVAGNALSQDAPTGPYTLPELPYAYDALEPHIDTETMKIHHDRHHRAYVDNANRLLQGHDKLSALSAEELVGALEEVPESIRQGLRNNAGGHVNHSLFWIILSPEGGGAPTGKLAEDINKTFGSFDKFREAFSKEASTRFGSGWAWLVVNPDGTLAITSTANQDSPLMTGQIPVLGLDVWEHAYYLKYQNKRGGYIDSWWNVVNWPKVSELYTQALAKVGAAK